MAFLSNAPWIYLHYINHKLVTEKFMGNHGFTVMFFPIHEDGEFEFTDIGEMFKLIRRYV